MNNKDRFFLIDAVGNRKWHPIYKSAEEAWAAIDNGDVETGYVLPMRVGVLTDVPRPVPSRPCVGAPGGVYEIRWDDSHYVSVQAPFHAQFIDVWALIKKLPFEFTNDEIRALLELPELTRKWITQGGAT